MMHLTSLGIKINDDSGVLFITASIIFSVSLNVLYPYRKRYYFYGAQQPKAINLAVLLYVQTLMEFELEDKRIKTQEPKIKST